MPGGQTMRFLRAAREHLRDAEVLLDAERFGGTVYLCGYGIECSLKALILGTVPAARALDFVDREFRGTRAHDFEHLRRIYRVRRGGPGLPEGPRAAVRRAEIVLTAGTDRHTFVERRYNVLRVRPGDARSVVAAGTELLRYAEGELQ